MFHLEGRIFPLSNVNKCGKHESATSTGSTRHQLLLSQDFPTFPRYYNAWFMGGRYSSIIHVVNMVCGYKLVF